ncbi:hypothetical protein D3C71_360830 [compost metagenome]
MTGKMLTSADLQVAFGELGQRALDQGLLLEISMYGGAAIMLAYAQRPATRDVDAVFHDSGSAVRRLAAEVARDHDWPEDWLNDGVKGFLSHRDREPGLKRLFGSYPDEKVPGLRVMVAAPEYLFAMKCMAMRIDDEMDNSTDVSDIRKLAAICDIRDASHAMNVVESFYPSRQISPKTVFGIEAIFENHTPDPKNDLGRRP